jgi:aminopeptidase-like protein
MLMEWFDRLFPINRSITGDGVRETLSILNEIVPICQEEFPTGMQCFDWTIPKEWNVREAYIKDSQGNILVDFRDNNLHLAGYSTPVRGLFSKAELMEHIHTLPELPQAIPYVTSYYKERWAFCVQHERLSAFTDKVYEVVIDATLDDGHLTIGEGYIQGESEKEILFSTYVCHPSMAINELSGPLVQTFIYQYLLEQQKPLKYSYRFVYVPETIGSIVYLSQYGEQLKERLAAGYVVTCVGHGEAYTYKKSKRGNSLADKAAIHVMRQSGKSYKVLDWSPFGSDERQYCSQAFNLPVGSLMRTMYGEYPEYHTSLDNRELISEHVLQETIDMYIDLIETLEANETYQCTHTHCEPKLDKRGLYPSVGGTRSEEVKKRIAIITNLIAFSDGEHDIMDIANKLNLMGKDLREDAHLLESKGLLIKSSPPSALSEPRRYAEV